MIGAEAFQTVSASKLREKVKKGSLVLWLPPAARVKCSFSSRGKQFYLSDASSIPLCGVMSSSTLRDTYDPSPCIVHCCNDPARNHRHRSKDSSSKCVHPEIYGALSPKIAFVAPESATHQWPLMVPQWQCQGPQSLQMGICIITPPRRFISERRREIGKPR